MTEPMLDTPPDPTAWHYASAADLELTPGDRLNDVRREPGLMSFVSASLIRRLTWCYFKTVHALRVTGREHLPARPPFIVVANHGSLLDAPALAVSLTRSLRRNAFPLAAQDTFFSTLGRGWMSAACFAALPLNRQRVGRQAAAQLRHRLEAGHSGLVVFPEGTRSRTGQIAAFKPGIGMLVAGLGVPVIPAWIEGSFAALPPGTRKPRRVPIHVRFGQPQCFNVPNTRAGWEDIAQHLHAAVLELRET